MQLSTQCRGGWCRRVPHLVPSRRHHLARIAFSDPSAATEAGGLVAGIDLGTTNSCIAVRTPAPSRAPSWRTDCICVQAALISGA